ncbi:hypothetical protein EMIT0P291_170057 [Pseudomonas sp. IT-P291]
MDPGRALALKQASSQTALRSLAFNWIRIVYDEKAYLQALTRRRSTEDLLIFTEIKKSADVAVGAQ